MKDRISGWLWGFINPVVPRVRDLRALLAAWITRGQSWRMEEEEEAGGEVKLQFPSSCLLLF